jgi:hypothetical protein
MIIPMLFASATDWTTAVAALVAALGGVGAFAVALIALRPQLSELRSVKRERETAQARRITAFAERRDERGRCLVVHNGSDEPIYECGLWLITAHLSDHESGMPPTDLHPTVFTHVVTPHDDFRYQIPVERLKGSAPSRRPPVEVVFCDANQRWWWRSESGRLRRLNAEESAQYQYRASQKDQ